MEAADISSVQAIMCTNRLLVRKDVEAQQMVCKTQCMRTLDSQPWPGAHKLCTSNGLLEGVLGV